MSFAPLEHLLMRFAGLAVGEFLQEKGRFNGNNFTQERSFAFGSGSCCVVERQSPEIGARRIADSRLLYAKYQLRR